MTILDQLAAHARERVAADQAENSLDVLQTQCRALGRGRGERFRSALAKPELSFICEVKKASPSKGIIAKEFPYLEIARDYERAGADAISCLTEPKWFLGSDQIFREIRGAVDTPMLRKDFTVDPYQLYQARLMGADCVLLICALLEPRLGTGRPGGGPRQEGDCLRRVRRSGDHRGEQSEFKGLLGEL